MESLKLRPQTVYAAVLEGGKNFEEMAPEYGMDVERFEETVRNLVGRKDYDRLKKASDRNKKNADKKLRKVSNTTQNACDEPNVETETSEENVNKVPDEEDNMNRESGTKKVIDARCTKLEELNVRKENAEKEISILNILLDGKKALLAGAQDEQATAENHVREAEKALSSAKEVLKQAKKNVTLKRSDVKKTENALAEWQKCRDIINADIAQHQVIYLVAPGYKGNLPKLGRLISVVAFKDTTVEVDDKIGELIHEPTRAEMRNSGFTDNKEMFTAYDFASLVVKYATSAETVKVLVDDERIKRILEGQGLEA